ncbi:helix-turn-helix domain-containing protein [Paraburkholderia silviterrae]|uniref:Helix-turn-helix domain-containing protein n=1 Tax=Paraburkholderia silviterrae TaxID=2528715 RepID=A0A4R5MGD2_9BURK|nr:helix-turn-helix domain-containing protein [Paraburkholderia silviterrae]TDG25800.1 helix-turn-helix domain-containing protein [Paraburkholderia silviterrae]
MDYSLKTVSQLRPMLLGFRKQAGLTQEKVAQRLGISQQSYAAFEAHPESASVDRLFRVLRLFAVEMRLSWAASLPMRAERGNRAKSAAAPAGPAKSKAPESRPLEGKARGAPANPPRRKAAAVPATRSAAAKKRAAPKPAPAAAPTAAPTRAAKRVTPSAAGKSTAPKTRAKPRKREDW